MKSSESARNLAAFENMACLRLRMSRLSDQSGHAAVAVQLLPAGIRSAAGTLVLIYDMSDSSVATSRLIRRIPDLLRGWQRETRVWGYALGAREPLWPASEHNVGHVLDDHDVLLQPFEDRALIARQRRRGSFLGPTLGCLAASATTERSTPLRIVAIGDGRFSDFAPVPVPDGADLVALVENQSSAAHAMAFWPEVLPGRNAMLLAFDDPRLKAWFETRGQQSRSERSLCFPANPDARVHVVDEQGMMSAACDNRINLDVRQFPIDIVITDVDERRLTIKFEDSSGVFDLAGQDIASVPALAEVDRVRFEGALNGAARPAPTTLFDSATAEADERDLWSATAVACANLQNLRVDQLAKLRSILSRKEQLVGAVIFANRFPDGSRISGDRLVMFALHTTGSSLQLNGRQKSAIGLIQGSWELSFDHLEDRWALFTRQAETYADAGADRRLLDFKGLQQVASLGTLDGTIWHAFLLLIND